MKTRVLFPIVFLITASTFGQTPPAGTISHSPDLNSNSGNPAVTNAPGQTYSLNEIAEQLRQLHRVMNETMPMLNAVTENQSNSAASVQSSFKGDIAGVLGNILHHNTNKVAEGSKSTNNWSNVFRGLLETNSVISTSSTSDSTTLNDLIALREGLQNLMPTIERLDAGSATSGWVQYEDQYSTNQLTPTGRSMRRTEKQGRR